MSSRAKLQKYLNNLPHMVDKDRISELPNCVIVKIISLLPTKDAVMTSALSTKWKHLWTFVTNLDFDDMLMDSTPSPKSFKRFVNRVLLLRDKSCLQRFRLKCNMIYDGSLVNAWIASVLPCNLQKLVLSIPIKNPILLPSSIFLCKTLVVLKLDAKGKVNMHTSISLPNLKILHLDKVELSHDVSIVNLLSGCPVLEELQLTQCIGKDVRVINITSPNLTCLTLILLAYDSENGSFIHMKYRIVLDTPSLLYFGVCDYIAEGYVVKTMHRLITASIGVSEYVEGEMLNKDLTDLLNAISYVQSLGLSSRTMKAISWFAFEIPEFRNLTSLEILASDSFASDVLETLLVKTPCLETLSLLQKGYNRNHFLSLSHNDIVPSCFRFHLKLIEIDGFVGVQEEMEMVEYILNNAYVLEKLTLRYRPFVYDSAEEAIFLKKLVMLPRTSTICQVEVV